MSKYIANNYKKFISLLDGNPIIITKAIQNKFYDNYDNSYFDATSSYCSANLGHSNPYFRNIIWDQMMKMSVCPRFVDNEQLNTLGGKVNHYFNKFINTKNNEHIKILPSLNGVDAFETSIKLSRAWGHSVKNIPIGKSIQLFLSGNFHGRTLSAISVSKDRYQKKFYPKNPNLLLMDMDDIDNFDGYIAKHNIDSQYISSITIEPIQMEGGVNIISNNKIEKIKTICDKNNILLICDEIQTGLFRTNKLLCIEHYNIKPDIILLGKSLGASYLPISLTIASNNIMDCIKEGEHGSTFGGNPLSCVVATSVLDYLHKNNIMEKNNKLAEYFSKFFIDILDDTGMNDIIHIENLGLLYGLKVNDKYNAEILSNIMLKNRIIMKDTKNNTLRFTPPFTIDSEKEELCELMHKSLLEFKQNIL